MIALANCERIKLKPRLNETYNSVKHKLPVLAKKDGIGERLIEAFGTDDKALIAEKLGFSTVQAVYKVISGERQLDFEKLQNFRAYTKRSIDWLLTGEEERQPEHTEETSFDEMLKHAIREIVQEEFRNGTFDQLLREKLDEILHQRLIGSPVQELGTVDEFDLAAAIKKYDNAIPVLKEWYAHDGEPMPQVDVLKFSGWKDLTLKQKIQQVKAVREMIDEDREFHERAKSTSHIKHS
jgi:transcriptional regulator with XRE-family HTH domain